MIRTLQKRFVYTAMLAVTVLLLVLLGALNLMNYITGQDQAEHMLEMLVERETHAAPLDVPQRGEKNFWNRPIDEDTAMSARYFVVRWDGNGTVFLVDVSHISSVTIAEAEEYGARVAARSAETGRMERFFYRMVSTPYGGMAAVFLDGSALRRSMLTILGISAVVGICCWLAMLLLVAALSRRAIRPIAENMERQKQFVTDAGHEIKTPLAIILANTEALELHNGESKWSRNIRTQTVRLNGLMQNLLTLARMEENGTKLTVENVNLSALTQETVEAFREPAALNNVALEQEIQPGVVLQTNREHMTRLLSILLDNAVKYVNAGGSIRLSLQKTEKGALLRVKNTCAQRPEEPPEEWFGRFYRGDSARTQKSGGYGIGLSVARAVVEAHGGAISASYEDENTVVFTVQL